MTTVVRTAGGGRSWRLDESVRAEAMAAFDIAALRDSVALRRITDFAAALCDVPIALVSLIEERCQRLIARTGLDLTETPRETSFCQYAMVHDTIMVVPDARADPRFVDNPMVTGDAHIRFYAGAPLVTNRRVPLGSLCVVGREVRPGGLTPLQHQGLLVLADDVMARFNASQARI